MKMGIHLRGRSVGHGRPSLGIHNVCQHGVLEHDAGQYSPRPPEVHLPDDAGARGCDNLPYIRIWSDVESRNIQCCDQRRSEKDQPGLLVKWQ